MLLVIQVCITGVALIPVIFLLKFAFTKSIFLFSLAVSASVFLFSFFYVFIIAFIMKSVFLIAGKPKEGVYPYMSREFNLHFFGLMMTEMFYRMPFYNLFMYFSPFSYISLKLFGAKTSYSVFVGADAKVFDPGFVEIGKNSYLAEKSLVSAHDFDGSKMIVKKVKIGKNVIIGARSIIGPGTIIHDNATIGANSGIKNKIVRSGEIWIGSPARKIIKKV